MTRPLTPSEDAALHFMLLPARIVTEAMKAEWAAQRARQRENLDLPPWERDDG